MAVGGVIRIAVIGFRWWGESDSQPNRTAPMYSAFDRASAGSREPEFLGTGTEFASSELRFCREALAHKLLTPK